MSEWLAGAARSAGSIVGGTRWAVRRVPRTRRLLLARALEKLELGDTIGTFAGALGQPRSSRRDAPWRRHKFETPDIELEAVTEDDDVSVVAYFVKSRTPKYHPRLVPIPPAVPPWDIKLGLTTFAQVGDWEPMKVDVAWGAVRWWYRELHYFGAPGGYRSFVFEVSDSEPSPEMVEFLRTYTESGTRSESSADTGRLGRRSSGDSNRGLWSIRSQSRSQRLARFRPVD